MLVRSSIIVGLLLLVVSPTPQDKIRQHYEAAEAARLAGNLETAEAEFAAILGEGYQRLGRIYSARSEYLPALSALETAQQYRPSASDVQVDLAIAYFGARQYEKALVAARKAISIAPDSPGAHQMLGKTHFMLGDLDQATAELETAAKLAPNDIDVAYTLGISYLRNRQPEKAKQLYSWLLKTFGEQPQLHVVIGRAYRQSGLLLDAAEEFKKAIALDPHFPRAHYYLGLTYLLDEGQTKIGAALEEFKIEVAANPDEFFSNYYLGVVYNYQREWELAITFLQKASTIQLNNPDPYFQLGQAYQELNRHQEAIEVLKKSIALNPNLAHNKGQVTTAHHRLAQSLIKTGQTEAGQKELQIASDLKAQAFKLEQQSQTGAPGTVAKSGSDQALGLTPENHGGAGATAVDEKSKQELQRSEDYYKKVVGTAHNNIGLLRAQRQLFFAAVEQFELAAKWTPQLEGLDYNLGLAHFKSQLYKRAVPALESELKAHPDNRPAAMLLGMTFFRLGNYQRASALLSGVVDAQTTDLNSYYSLASSLIRLRKMEAAEEVIGQIKTSKPDAPQLHLLLAEKYDISGVPLSALAELKQVADSNSETLQVHYNAGLLYLKLGKRDEATKEFERELVFNPADTQAKYSLSDVLLRVGNVERGLTLLREVIQARPDHAEARYSLGKTLLQRGDTVGAIENLERAAKLEPEWPDVHFELGQAYVAAGRKSDGKKEIDLSKQLRSRTQKP
jgi:tetratricopeptide (TPR) repeat protein